MKDFTCTTHVFISYSLIESLRLNSCGGNSLNDDSSRCTTAIANRCNTIFPDLQLMHQRSKDPRPRASKGMAQRDSAAKWIHIGTFKGENLVV